MQELREEDAPDDSAADAPRTKDNLNESSGETSTSGRGGETKGGLESDAEAALAHLNSLFEDDSLWGVGSPILFCCILIIGTQHLYGPMTKHTFSSGACLSWMNPIPFQKDETMDLHFGDNICAQIAQGGEQNKRPKAASFQEDEDEEEEDRILCARCYSLQHYG